MREAIEFEVDGLTFEFSEMPLAKTCEGAELVSELYQAGFSGTTVPERIAAGAQRAIGKLPAMMALFVPFCKVESEGLAQGKRVKLDKFQGDVFNGRIDRALLFVANCAAIEYGDFLSEGLARVALGLAELVERYPSLTPQTPTSGD
jgi:hypothetical protein